MAIVPNLVNQRSGCLAVVETWCKGDHKAVIYRAYVASSLAGVGGYVLARERQDLTVSDSLTDLRTQVMRLGFARYIAERIIVDAVCTYKGVKALYKEMAGSLTLIQINLKKRRDFPLEESDVVVLSRVLRQSDDGQYHQLAYTPVSRSRLDTAEAGCIDCYGVGIVSTDTLEDVCRCIPSLPSKVIVASSLRVIK